MYSFLIGLVGKFLHVHPMTAQTKTFGGGIATIGSCIAAEGVLVSNGETRVIMYVYPVIGVLIALGQIFHRDALTKLGNTLSNILPKQ
jgi:hypothetical protein